MRTTLEEITKEGKRFLMLMRSINEKTGTLIIISVSQRISNFIGSLVGSLQPFIKSDTSLAHLPNLRSEAPSVSLFLLCCEVKLETGAASRP